MKCLTPEIAWHNRDPVFSIDIQPRAVNENVYRLASGGSDTHILIWYIHYEYTAASKGVSDIEFVADLTRHQKAVNIVRFSPSGEYLASGDDESVVLVWKKKKDSDNPDFSDLETDDNKEHWTCAKTLRLHIDDVYDLSWSSDSTHLVSGSVDNTAVMWNIVTGTKVHVFREHKGFVQGVSWDPLLKYVATLSSDRTLRVFSTEKKNLVCQCSKAVIPQQTPKEEPPHATKIFHDDTLKTFYRRLSFSPDGSLLIVPSGILETQTVPQSSSNSENASKPKNATYIFSRNSFNEPVMYYPSGDQFSVAVRCCPILFQSSKTNEKKIFDLPYKMVIAVATKNHVLLYDTDHASPFGLVTDIHYTRITDLSWSNDGLLLVVSSTDGFCSFITFAEGELGERWQKPEPLPQKQS
ncbi:chromatin assembly factor 1 subunit B [Planococcus citri]|uniref:chromatin assembly factor 1 subunit B n=1 Tax=Planococcus citri TaxID=170843 RepID=UPI0031F9FFD3